MTAPSSELRSPAAEGLSIVIPAFNEEAGIGATLAALAAEPRLAGAAIVVVDDCSTDRTGAIARQHGAQVVRNRRNLGYGAALKKGIERAQTRWVAWFDADGQHRAADLADMLTRAVADEADAVIGARTKDSHVVAQRVAGKRVIKLAAEAAVGMKIPDVNCGLRVFRRTVLLRYLHLLPDGFSASTTSTLVLLKRQYHVVFHPVHVPRRLGTSTVRQVRDGLRTLHTILRILILFNAFRSFSMVAAVLVSVGTAYGLYEAIVDRLGFPVLAELVILLGVQIFTIGIVCDQISAMRLERLERPGRLDDDVTAPWHGELAETAAVDTAAADTAAADTAAAAALTAAASATASADSNAPPQRESGVPQRRAA